MDTSRKPKVKALPKRQADMLIAARLEQLAIRPHKNPKRKHKPFRVDDAPAVRLETLGALLTLAAVRIKRRSLRKAQDQLHWHTLVSMMGAETLLAHNTPPPVTVQGDTACRAYDRAHRLLLRLVQRGVERQWEAEQAQHGGAL